MSNITFTQSLHGPRLSLTWYLCCTWLFWAAQYSTWLLINLTPKVVVFCFLVHMALTVLCGLVHSPSHPPAVEDPYIDFLHSCATSSLADDNSGSIEAAPGDVAAADVAPGHVAPGDVAAADVVLGDVAPTDVAPDDVAANDVATRAGIRKKHLLAFLSQIPASEISAALERLGAYALSCMPFVLFNVAS